MAIDQVLDRAAMLERAMDKVVESAAEDPETQAYADWAWYRFKSVIDLVLQRGAGPVAASLARGLLEEAAYWDWALATGVGAQHLVRRAAVEYDGLVRLASEVDDDVWVGWLLPPGAVLSAPADDPIPRNASDVVKRIGNGLAAPVLDSLRFRGLFAANHLLDVLTHGNLAAALVMAPGGGEEMPEPLAAAVVHVAAGAATATKLPASTSRRRESVASPGWLPPWQTRPALYTDCHVSKRPWRSGPRRRGLGSR